MPVGAAGVLAGCCGVAGAVVGMSEVWYTGPIAQDAGSGLGADLGFEVSLFCTFPHRRLPDWLPVICLQLAAAFAGGAYPPLRWLEIRIMGR